MATRSKSLSCSLPDLHAPGEGTLKWRCQSHGLLISPQVPAKRRPRWLTTQSLSKREYLSKATGNVHGLKSEDYTSISWPMPKMFGAEKYGFTLVELEWRRVYKELLRAEHHKKTLPKKGVTAKTEGTLQSKITGFMEYLLQLQEQRDQYDELLGQAQTWASGVKADIKQENDLESLRQEQVQRVKEHYGPGNEFWKQEFSVT